MRARIIDALRNPEARPSAVRLGYHVSGTFDVNDPERGGGSDGAGIYISTLALVADTRTGLVFFCCARTRRTRRMVTKILIKLFF